MNRRQLFGFMAAAPLVPAALAEAVSAPALTKSFAIVDNGPSTIVHACNFISPIDAERIHRTILARERQILEDVRRAWRRAEGGPMPEGMTYLVGEKGPEFVVPAESINGVPSSTSEP